MSVKTSGATAADVYCIYSELFCLINYITEVRIEGRHDM